MPDRPSLYFWKRAPFSRLIIPLIIGITLQFTFQLPVLILLAVSGFLALCILVINSLTLSHKYSLRWVAGLIINFEILIVGACLMRYQDARNTSNWFGYYTAYTKVMATIQEPLVEKAKTYKAAATIEAVYANNTWKKVNGKTLVYFSKDSLKKIEYGSLIIFNKSLQEITNSGNPGEFDYKQYNRFKNVFHQVFLKSDEYIVTDVFNGSTFKSWLFSVRTWVIKKLQQYIPARLETGVAEALLLGYRDDLDKDLVQAYRNTGVVHIIAISGLHLGLIYLLLLFILKPFKRMKWMRWIQPAIILIVLWIFTLLAGAVPSIVRSAVMFSFIVVGEIIDRKTSIYNTLASSAFIMLCINPYYLFDVGFQLSYAAVISIVTFYKGVYTVFSIQNKLLDFIAKLVAVTLSAQVLTLPIVFYAFHQFPVFFILSNMVVVPLASIILFSELLLLLATIIPFAAQFVGFITGALLSFMNGYIKMINSLPYSVYDGIQNSVAQTLLLYILIVSTAYWLLNKTKPALFTSVSVLFMLVVASCYSDVVSRHQQKIIVYNIARHKAIDFVVGERYAFVGDDTLAVNGDLAKYVLQPSRTLHHIHASNNLNGLYISYPFIQFFEKRIVVIDSTLHFETSSKIPVDLIIVSHNPRLSITEMSASFNCKQFVFDASNNIWKINQWKKECENLHLRHYSTPEKGAFVLNL